ncbi:hypothetical protein SteCoe_10935 [Stentor coeruleus]|uniref:Major facilitator superfamily (MFS) profile domain-containing protein n=1 Tax=Stentor coeruleus TaxID=5963 RepID=A0A1R2CEG4_9CILI|nr:hypothetical protein SteCoe_10935 [Stentor coeruleus]
MKDSHKYLIGLFLFRSIIGTQNFWGMLSPYATSYFYEINSKVTGEIMSLVIPISYTTEAIVVVFSAYVDHKIGTKMTLVLAAILLSSSFFIPSFIRDPYWFVILFGITNGAASGLTLMPSVWPGWEHFPNNKGLIMGLNGIFYTSGSIYGFIMSYIINPNDFKPVLKNDIYYFDEKINSDFIFVIRLFSGVFLIIGLIGAFLINHPKSSSTITSQQPKEPEESASRVIKTSAFWIISLIFFFGIFYRIFFLSEYKRLALSFFSDQELTIVGFIGTITEIIAQTIIGICYDKYDGLIVSKIFSSLVLINCLTYYFTTENIIAYTFAYSLLTFSTVYIFNSIATLVNHFFPKDHKIGFSLVSSGFVASSIACIILEKFLIVYMSFESILEFFSIVNTATLGLFFMIGFLYQRSSLEKKLLDD